MAAGDFGPRKSRHPHAVAGGNAVAAWVSRVDECAVRNTQDGRTEGDPLTNESSTRPVERLFPFVSRARILIIGRDTLRRSKGRLHFVLITVDISENSRAEILKDFGHYPVVQHYTPEELEKFFGIKKAKVVGFQKSGLAQSMYAELKQHRIN